MSQTPNQDAQNVVWPQQTTQTPQPAVASADGEARSFQEAAPSSPVDGDESLTQPLASPERQLPPLEPPAPRRRGRDTTIISALLAILITIGGAVFGPAAYNNNQQVLSSRARATAQVATATFQAAAQAQASATAVASTYPFSNNLILNDPLTDNSRVGQYGWNEDANCFFRAGSYHVLEKSPGQIHLCVANTPTFTDFTFQVQMTIKSGGTNAAGGVIFRADATNYRLYMLFLDTQGNYELDTWANQSGSNNRTLKSGSVAGFLPGSSQAQTIGIVAKGSAITLFVNRVQVAQIFDSTYLSGQIGVISSYGSSATEVDYNNAQVWQL